MAYNNPDYKKEWNKRNPDKLRAYQKKYRQLASQTPEYKEKVAARNRKWYLEHKEEVRASSKEWSLNNKEKISENKKRYHVENREHIIEVNRNHYIKNRDLIRKKNAAYGKSPAGRRAAKASYAKRRSAEGSFTAEDIKDLYATQGGSCYYCSVNIEAGYHVEHMTPLSRGGRNDVSNICLACAPCNLRKHTKTAEEFQNG